MPGAVERWLETFMCKQYADSFEAYGFQTLQSVCQLQLSQLLVMGVAREHCDTILENVHVLRQTMMGSVQQYPEDMSRGYNSEPHMQLTGMNKPFQHSDSGPRGNLSMNVSMYGQHGGNYGNQDPMMMSQQHPHNQNISTQGQHYNQMYRNPYPGPGPGYQTPRHEMGSGQDMGYPNRGPRFQTPNFSPRSQYPVTQVQGSMNASPVSVQQAHPHLRNSGQNPQEVANNILQMTSSYPAQHTVQVPLSKNRPAPYQVPPRSPHYNISPRQPIESQFHGQMGQPQDYPSHKNFAYPSASPHTVQPNRMSPVSPQSHHSSQSLLMSSPHGSVHSPVPGNIRSPLSDAGSVRSPILNAQPLTSQQGMNYQQIMSQQHHQGVKGHSPVPVNQQLQVTVPPNSSGHRAYRSSGELVCSPGNQQLPHHSSQFSPNSNPMLSPGRFSNISSPCTPGSKGSHHSPSQSFIATSTASQYLSDTSSCINFGALEKSGGSSPLKSLQKLCMLPERQVVDPKSVVNDACASSPKPNTCSKNFEPGAGLLDSPLSDKRAVGEPASDISQQCKDGSNCSPVPESSVTDTNNKIDNLTECSDTCNIEENMDQGEEQGKVAQTAVEKLICDSNPINKFSSVNPTSSSHTADKTNAERCKTNETPSEEMKRQPKKELLLRAVQDDAYKQQESKADHSGMHLPEAQKNKSESCEPKEAVEKCSDADSRSDLINNKLDKTEKFLNEISPPEEHKLSNQNTSNSTAGKKTDGETNPKSEQCGKDNVHKDDEEQSDIPSEIPPKARGQSFGSCSDENGELDLQDHIGCDDIDSNQISDESVLEKENIMDLDNTLSVENRKNLSSSNEVKSAIIGENGCKVKLHSSPHWKKSRLNDLQALKHGNTQNNDAERASVYVQKDTIKCKKKPRIVCRNSRIRKPVNCSMEVNGQDSDSDGISHGNISDIGIDNGDGTMTISKRTTSRLRKQPLKYKDASFLQCDFIFADEEENEDLYFEPKKKYKRMANHISAEPNEVVKKPDSTDQTPKNGKIPFKKNGLSKTHQQSKEENNVIIIKRKTEDKKTDSHVGSSKVVKNDISVVQKSSCDTDCNDDDDIGASLEFKVNKGVSDNELPPKSCDKENGDCLTSKEKEIKNRNAVLKTNKVAKNVCVKSDSRKTLNQVKKTKGDSSASKHKTVFMSKESHKHSTRSGKQTNSDVGTSLGDSVDGVVSTKEEQAVVVNMNHVVEKVKSDDKNNTAANEEETPKAFDEVTVDLTYSDNECLNDTGELVNGSSSVKLEGNKRVKKEHSKLERNFKAVIKSDKQKAKAKLKGSKANQRNRKRKAKQKTNFYENDSDFEAGPKPESFKSLKLSKTHDLLSKKKKQETRGFKGPMIHIEGSKEFPDKCAVVNQPFQEGDLKANKAKTVVQSSIEISHLPSDRSVFVPNAETEEPGNWVCVLCGKHSSYKFTGDLFGPYTLDVPMEGEKLVSPKQTVTGRGNRSRSVDSTSGQSSRSSKSSQRSMKETNLWKEVWVHECCAVWADGVFLIGTKIYGLQEAAKIACKTVCSRCHEHGAMIGCLHKGCQMKFHHSCALEEDCVLEEENFSLLCPKHKSKKLRQPDPSFSSWG